MLPIRKICSKIKLSFCFREVENTYSKQIRQENNCMCQMFSVKNWEAACSQPPGKVDFFFFLAAVLVKGRGLGVLVKHHPASSPYWSYLGVVSNASVHVCGYMYVCVCISNHYQFNYYDSGFRKENWLKKKKQWEASIRFCLVAIFTVKSVTPKCSFPTILLSRTECLLLAF